MTESTFGKINIGQKFIDDLTSDIFVKKDRFTAEPVNTDGSGAGFDMQGFRDSDVVVLDIK